MLNKPAAESKYLSMCDPLVYIIMCDPNSERNFRIKQL